MVLRPLLLLPPLSSPALTSTPPARPSLLSSYPSSPSLQALFLLVSYYTFVSRLPSNGLEEAYQQITVLRYKRKGLVDGTDCSVCLGEFKGRRKPSALPKCSHAFHLQCIDTWLKSHANCPLCRANIVLELDAV
ncbi:E3 ubiquitin-protein ligase [Dendrobium catenatum]|uniref:RING-type E3 ubiquitin transferase n=1 Tax=Dendrobium catenatum TaxID=906689 RepID=A0A2I0X1R9_9ASPA|nr:E3 ubiquitin-protein ligase [Dendrobium catenatum]